VSGFQAILWLLVEWLTRRRNVPEAALDVTGAREMLLLDKPLPTDGGLVAADTNDPMQTSRGNALRCECTEDWTSATCGTDFNECTVSHSGVVRGHDTDLLRARRPRRALRA
jgi:hypothetical protein